MSYYDISQSLKNILIAVRDGAGGRLAEVYDTEVPKSVSYPYAVIAN